MKVILIGLWRYDSVRLKTFSFPFTMYFMQEKNMKNEKKINAPNLAHRDF